MTEYVPTEGIPRCRAAEDGQAGAVIDGWMVEADVTISAVQCWTSLEEFYGVVPCTLMSMMSNELLPSARARWMCAAP